MGLQNKIKELLEEKIPQSNSGDTDFPAQGGSKKKIEKNEFGEYNQDHAGQETKDTSVPVSDKGDTKFPTQKDSKTPDVDDLGAEEMGKEASKAEKKDKSITAKQTESDFPKQGDSKNNISYNVLNFTKEEIDADLSSIFGDALEESIKDKATTIFEAAVISRVNMAATEIIEQLSEQYETRLAEETQSIQTQIDKYLDYIVEEWMERNTLAIERGMRESVVSNFIEGLHDLFEQHYIDVPEGKQNVIDKLAEENVNLKKELNQALSESIELRAANKTASKKDIFDEVSEGMTAIDVDRFSTLINGIEFINEDTYREKLNVIKESHIKSAKPVQKSDPQLDSMGGVQNVSEIAEYAKIISRTFGNKK